MTGRRGEFNGIEYTDAAELCTKLIHDNGGETVRPESMSMGSHHHDLGRQLVSQSFLPQHRVMRKSAVDGDAELHVFDFGTESGVYTVLMYLIGESKANLYAIDREGATEVLFQLRESAEFQPEETGYLLKRALGMSDYKLQESRGSR